MCTVCQKIYGRYNSVSYHVTIYHRNPPIQCNEGGCQFSTREARYIHFHRFYRHHIPLPENIDLGATFNSRKIFADYAMYYVVIFQVRGNVYFAVIYQKVQRCLKNI